MDDTTRKMILTAWRENRLAAVHVDLQTVYNRSGTEKAYDTGARVAAHMRGIKVPNIWVTMPVRVKPAITTVRTYNRYVTFPEEALSLRVGATDGETVVMKDVNSAFSHPHAELHRLLRDMRKDTLLIGGVYSDMCVMETLRDAVMADKYNVVAVLDAIDTSPHIDYAKLVRLRCSKPEAFRRNFHSATSGQIMETLAAPYYALIEADPQDQALTL